MNKMLQKTLMIIEDNVMTMIDNVICITVS